MRELVTIKDGNKIAGFILYDGNKTKICTVEETKKYAAREELDTLKLENGELVPNYLDEALKDIKNVNTRKRLKNRIKSMTMQEYIAQDSIFRKKDIDKCLEDYRSGTGTIDMCFGYQGRLLVFVTLYAYSSTVDRQLQEFVKDLMSRGLITSGGQRYGGIIKFTMVVDGNNKTHNLFDELNYKYDIQINWNPNVLTNYEERRAFFVQNLPFAMRKIYGHLSATQEDIDYLRSACTKYSI